MHVRTQLFGRRVWSGSSGELVLAWGRDQHDKTTTKADWEDILQTISHRIYYGLIGSFASVTYVQTEIFITRTGPTEKKGQNEILPILQTIFFSRKIRVSFFSENFTNSDGSIRFLDFDSANGQFQGGTYEIC